MDELPALFQDIQFHRVVRGYDIEEVDAYVARVAQAAALVHGRIAELQNRAESAEDRLAAGAPSQTEETLTRTLLLAQRTADAAVAEAEQEAAAIRDAASAERSQILAEAEAEIAAGRAEAEQHAGRVLAEAETDRRQILADAEVAAAAAAAGERDRLTAEVQSLNAVRGFLQDDVDLLERHLLEQRSGLVAAVAALQELVEQPEILRVDAMPALSGIVVPEPKLELEPEPEAELALELEPEPEAELAESAPEMELVEPGSVEMVAEEESVEIAPAPEAELVEPELVETALLEPERPESEPATEAIDMEGLWASAPASLADLAEPELSVDEIDAALAAAPVTDWLPEFDTEPAWAPETQSDHGGDSGAGPEPDPGLDLSGGGEVLDLRADIDLTVPAIDEPTGIDPLFEPTGEHPVVGGTMVEPIVEAAAPPRLVTAADIEADSSEAVELAPDSLFVDPGPTASASDPFLEQLREAVSRDDVVDNGDDALAAFFDGDDGEDGRSWFPRRR